MQPFDFQGAEPQESELDKPLPPPSRGDRGQPGFDEDEGDGKHYIYPPKMYGFPSISENRPSLLRRLGFGGIVSGITTNVIGTWICGGVQPWIDYLGDLVRTVISSLLGG